MNVMNVVKPLQDRVISNIIKEHILERNLINVMRLKTFNFTIISKDVKEHMLLRKLINVFNVVKSIHKGEVSKVSLLDRNLMNIIMN